MELEECGDERFWIPPDGKVARAYLGIRFSHLFDGNEKMQRLSKKLGMPVLPGQIRKKVNVDAYPEHYLICVWEEQTQIHVLFPRSKCAVTVKAAYRAR